ncbi:MAG: hypothetical protein QOH78_2007 [Verrucomicrobiota bacterium]
MKKLFPILLFLLRMWGWGKFASGAFNPRSIQLRRRSENRRRLSSLSHFFRFDAFGLQVFFNLLEQAR